MRIYEEAEAIYRNPDGDAAEVVAAVRAARIGLRATGPGVFRVQEGGDFSADWKRWVGGDFRERHAPQLAAVHRVALEEGALEVAELDRVYGEWLEGERGDDLVEASLRLGGDVLEALKGARSVRLVERLSKAVVAGRMKGHFVTLIGCHAAVMNVALAHGLITLAFHEWKLAGGGDRVPRGTSAEEGFGHDAEDAGLLGIVGEVMRGGGFAEGEVECA